MIRVNSRGAALYAEKAKPVTFLTPDALPAGVEPLAAQNAALTATTADFQRAILSDAAYGIISTDTTGCITSFNPAAEKLLGWKAEELISKTTLETLSPVGRR